MEPSTFSAAPNSLVRQLRHPASAGYLFRMGLEETAAQFLMAAQRGGTDFSKTLTLGRQQMMMSPWQAQRIGLAPDVATGFADSFFAGLGAQTVDSLDASDFEGASMVHDLNQPIGTDQMGRYSVVVDGGTLEHIFDIPTALRSVLSMVAENGHFLSISPVNNEAGHGFYQFSPELWFRVLSSSNGYRVKRILIREMHPRGRWYEVTDPAKVGSREQFRSRYPTYMFIDSVRESVSTPVLRDAPQQSDYAMRWEGDRPRAEKRHSLKRRSLKSLLVVKGRHWEALGRNRIGRPVFDLSQRDTMSMTPTHFRRVPGP
jgi:hypothetical protein